MPSATVMKPESRRAVMAALSIAAWLFALRMGFSALFGILYDGLFEGPLSLWTVTAVVLLFLALLLPALGRRLAHPWGLATLMALTWLAQALLVFNVPGLRYWAALLGGAAGGLFLAALAAYDGGAMAVGLLWGLALDQALLAWGHTLDWRLHPDAALPVFFVSLLLSLTAFWWALREPATSPRPVRLSARGALGWGAALYLWLNLLSMGHALGRWAEVPYAWAAPLALAVTLAVAWWAREASLPGFWLGVLVAVALVVGFHVQGGGALAGLLLALALFLLALPRLWQEGEPSDGPWALAGLVFLALSFAKAFAFTYPYTLPFMRGMGLPLDVLAALLVGLGVSRPAQIPANRPAWGTGALALVMLAWGVVRTQPAPLAADPSPGRLVAAQYNIHYGFDDPWHLSLDAQAEALRQVGADLVTLEEVDTGRVTSFGADDAEYLAWRLGMRAVYLPTVEKLTGIALLSRLPIQAHDARWVTSTQEQTGVVHAVAEADGRPVHLFGYWGGLSDEDTLRQHRELLDFIGEATPAILGGDFNQTPDTPEYDMIAAAGFTDPFVALGVLPAYTDPAINPSQRIDYLWLRGLRPVRAWVSEALASDHRMIAVEVAFP